MQTQLVSCPSLQFPLVLLTCGVIYLLTQGYLVGLRCPGLPCVVSDTVTEDITTAFVSYTPTLHRCLQQHLTCQIPLAIMFGQINSQNSTNQHINLDEFSYFYAYILFRASIKLSTDGVWQHLRFLSRIHLASSCCFRRTEMLPRVCFICQHNEEALEAQGQTFIFRQKSPTLSG